MALLLAESASLRRVNWCNSGLWKCACQARLLPLYLRKTLWSAWLSRCGGDDSLLLKNELVAHMSHVELLEAILVGHEEDFYGRVPRGFFAVFQTRHVEPRMEHLWCASRTLLDWWIIVRFRKLLWLLGREFGFFFLRRHKVLRAPHLPALEQIVHSA